MISCINEIVSINSPRSGDRVKIQGAGFCAKTLKEVRSNLRKMEWEAHYLPESQKIEVTFHESGKPAHKGKFTLISTDAVDEKQARDAKNKQLEREASDAAKAARKASKGLASEVKAAVKLDRKLGAYVLYWEGEQFVLQAKWSKKVAEKEALEIVQRLALPHNG